MSRLPQTRRLVASDYESDDVQRLVGALNVFLTDTSDALRGLSAENLRCAVRTIDVTMPVRDVSPTLSGGWTGTASFRKDDSGLVRLAGSLSGGTYGSSAIFTLPAGYRPAANRSFEVVQTSLFTPAGRLNVLTTGEVVAPAVTSVQSGTSSELFLDGVVFLAADERPPVLGTPFPLLLDVSEVREAPNALLVLGCEDWTGGSGVAAPYPDPSWDIVKTGGARQVRLSHLSGLVPGRRYRVRLAALAL